MRIYFLMAAAILISVGLPAAAQTTLYNKPGGEKQGARTPYQAAPPAQTKAGKTAPPAAPAASATAKRAANMAIMQAQRTQMADFLGRQQTQLDTWLMQKMAAQAAGQAGSGVAAPVSGAAPAAPANKNSTAPKSSRPIYNDPRKAPAPPKVFKDF